LTVSCSVLIPAGQLGLDEGRQRRGGEAGWHSGAAVAPTKVGMEEQASDNN